MASSNVKYKAKDGTLISLTTKVINNTTSTSTTDALSAAQGKELNDNKAASKVLAVDTDLNTVKTPGMYSCGGGNSIKNKPDGLDAIGLIVVHNASGEYYTQILTTSTNTSTYRRSCVNGTWNAWTIDKYTDTTYSKSSLGLGNVDNTADANKSVKYATAAGSANAVAWGNVTGKPSTFTPAAHAHDHLERVEDTRSTTTKPSDYKNGFKFIGIKTLKAAGISASESEYCCLIGMNGWTDKSGGGATEIAIDISGRMFYRHQNMNSENDSFDTWRLVLTSDYVVDSLTTNYPNMPLSAHMGFELANRIYALDKSTLGKTDIIDNLNDTSTDKVLSANQGKVLNETKVNQPIYSTTDLTPGVSDLADGQIYVVYYN